MKTSTSWILLGGAIGAMITGQVVIALVILALVYVLDH